MAATRAVSLFMLTAISVLAPISAHADTACRSVDQLSHSVSLVRELNLNTASGSGSAASKIDKLDRIMRGESFDVLLSREAKTLLPEEKVSIARFRARVELAIAQNKLGQSAIASELFASAMSENLSSSIVRLQRSWSCTSLDLNGQRALTLNAVPVAMDRRSAPLREIQMPTSEPANDHSTGSNRKNQAQKPRVSAEPKRKNHPLNLKNTSVLGSIIFVLAGIICFLLWRSRQTKSQTKRAQRYGLQFPVRIRQNGDRKPAKLVEISVSGCKIKHSIDALDKKISIRLLDRVLKARVVWANDHYAGVKFTKPIEFEQLNRIVRTARNSVSAV
jgi:hypothetical protein